MPTIHSVVFFFFSFSNVDALASRANETVNKKIKFIKLIVQQHHQQQQRQHQQQNTAINDIFYTTIRMASVKCHGGSLMCTNRIISWTFYLATRSVRHTILLFNKIIVDFMFSANSRFVRKDEISLKRSICCIAAFKQVICISLTRFFFFVIWFDFIFFFHLQNNTSQDGEFPWSSSVQSIILSSFFYGYVLTQIPFGMLAKRYGALGFLGWGMLLNSVFAFLVPVAARQGGVFWLCVVRFIQGLGEGPIVPCTHAMLAKWIPPNERSRMGAAVYAGNNTHANEHGLREKRN